MFGNTCKRCNEKVSKSSNFCGNCGLDLSRNYDPRDYGMIGRDDFGPLNDMPMGLGSLFGNIMKEMMKQMNDAQKEMREPHNHNHEHAHNHGHKPKQGKDNTKVNKSGISISISSTGDGQPKIKIEKFGDAAKKNLDDEESEIQEIIPNNEISDEVAKQYAKLPKEEAKSKVRRLSNKIIYEIELPGVTSLEDIIINRLEEGIEVRAFAEKKSYFKNLPVNYPITKYSLSKGGKLLIELREED